ncbi:ABC transporter permease subunit [Enterobacter hormaechei]|uniref:ABC transporter permease subunit n=1 Tax=Enterobacter cloacae complex TaxID=354276 RepID=UPI000760C01A|nr:ABC transporter permease subunit [Enterobacter hormaechei]MBG0610867.1 ABC transporter permease subunit [Enterobacter hormaechei]MCM7195344.1 ABC transporter permease subunit [Enterobacter hormaechei]MCM7358222.1 ABC transporter permease subunit [Enterobacter hormaechei]MCW4941337.1 ABC transporter permease subunit [Enterobacter hormaechei subsp. xiangfangensis]MCW4974800.1 ABC transporter permease subunit [Enterobacter hormaechei subsp. xiangfangensis]
MASPLRDPLSGLVWAAMAVIYLPLLPASGMLLAPAFSLSNWATLFADPQLPRALAATLVSTLIATLGSLFIALILLALLWPGEGWQRLSTRLPWLLAVPHVAFATSALLLFAEGGQFYRICTVCSPQLDRYGIGLGLTLAVKESAFVLWAIYAALPEKRLAQQKIVLHTFGYGRMQALNWLVLPAIAPALGAVMLAVLAWQWLTQGDAQQQTKGTLLCLVLLLLLAALAAVGYGFWTAWRRAQRDPSGVRRASHTALPARTLGGLLPLCGVLCALVLLMLARRDDIGPVSDSLSLGLLSSLTALAILMLWLEWGPQRGAVWVWLPLALPALPLVSGQYAVALWLGIDGQYAAVLWSHMLWVLPWMLLVLQPAWRRLDPRLILTARTLGWRQTKIFWLVKCPLMIRPALLAFATGFSVSMAQYMPTLWLGAGRFTTLTTEAVALSSGGSIPILASRALGLLLLSSSVFALAALLSRLVGRHRQGLR